MMVSNMDNFDNFFIAFGYLVYFLFRSILSN
jgi:hypothetical protein